MKSIIIVSLLLFCTVGGASAWYDGFDYRIPITIDNVGNPALEDYQFNVSFSPGINETSIRIVNDTDYTIVPHWCENETEGLCHELWFNVSVGSEVNTDYYIYYGNDSFSSTSDYDNTFTKKYNDSGLVLELHMDEGTGNSVTVDSSGEGNNGTLTNMNTTGNATSGWQGTDGGQWDNRSDVIFVDEDHLQFDGVNDYVGCGNDQSLNCSNGITIGVWIKTNTLTGNHIIIDKYWNRYSIGQVDNTIELSYRNQSSNYHAVTVDLVNFTLDTNWHNIFGIINPLGDVSVYADGKFLQSAPFVGTSIQTTTHNLEIGTYGNNWGHRFDGAIDEVRIYNRSLSGDEIYRQYIRSKYAANTPTISIGYIEKIPHPFLSGAYLFYGEMSTGLTNFKNEMGRYLIWGVLFFAVSLAFALIAKIKTTLIGGK